MGRVVIPGFRKIEVSGGGEGGTTNYNDLTNKPSINNVPLVGNLNTVDLKLTDKTLTEEGVPAEAKTVGTKLEEQSTSLTALSEQLGSHTVKSDVPENAVFTDTVYDYSALLGYDIYNLVALKDATYPANKAWLSKDFIAPFDGYIYFMVQTDATSGAFTQVFREDDVLVSNNQKNIADFNTWGEAYRHQIYKGKTYHFGSYTNTATAFNKVMLCIRKKLETPTEYVPYAPSNVALVEKTTNLDNRLSDNGYGEVAGGKNLVKPTLEAIKQTGITLTQKNNKIHIEGTSTENTFINFVGIVYLEKGKKYKFLPANIGTGNIYIQLPEPIYQGTTFTWELESQYVSITINVWDAQTVNADVVLMITDSIDATLNDFEPYFPSNKMLAEEKADKSEITVNLLNTTFGTTTLNGVTCINNGDGTYTLNGTANGTATFILKGGFNCSQFIGMKLVGCPSGAVVDGVRKFSIVMEATASPWNTHADDIGNGSIIVGPSGNSNLFIIVYQGATVNNLVFKPMITTNLDATYDDFVPYTGDTGKLNSDVAKLKNDLDKLSSLPIGSIIQIDESKDDPEITTQKYGWQYLGKSNIEYDRGSAILLATNVYRKNE